MLFSYDDRIIKEGRFILINRTTIRKTAAHFKLSKSCVHKDVNQKLKIIDFELYLLVKKVLQDNFADKHLRGGRATQKKYIEKRRLSQGKSVTTIANVSKK